MKRWGPVLVMVSLTIGLAGAVSAQETEGDTGEVVLRIGTTNDLTTDNPWALVAGYDWGVATIQYDMLLRFGERDLSPAPGLAERCEPSPDHTVWTCTIRDGVRWSDGTPLTAEDVAFTYRFVIRNNISAYRSYFPYNPTFETPDAHTLVWRSERPTFAPQTPPFVYIAPRHVWERYDGRDRKEIRSAPNTPAIASGPFVLTSWERGQGWTMERNPYFWGDPPTVDRLEFRVFDNQEALVQALKNGEVDYADGIQPSVFRTLEGIPAITPHRIVSDWWLNLAFNFGGQSEDADPHPALADPAVRRAIAMAIDKREIVEKVYLGYATPGDTIVRPASAYWHLDIPESEEYPYDPAAANALLDEAGYLDRDGDGIREDPRSGRPFSLLMPASDETTGAVDAGRLIVGYLAEIGMDVRLQPASDAKMNDYWTTGDFDMYIWYWSGDPDPDYQLWVFTSGQCGSWSDGCWSDPTYDRLYEQQRETFDREQRREIVFQAQRYVYEQLPVIVLAYPNSLAAYRNDRFTGWLPIPAGDGYLISGYSYRNLLTLRPVAGASSPPSPGPPGWLWLMGAAALLIVAARVVVRRRREEAEP